MILGLTQVCVVLLLKYLKKTEEFVLNICCCYQSTIQQFAQAINAVVFVLLILLELLSPCCMIKYRLGIMLILGIISINIDFGSH